MFQSAQLILAGFRRAAWRSQATSIICGQRAHVCPAYIFHLHPSYPHHWTASRPQTHCAHHPHGRPAPCGFFTSAASLNVGLSSSLIADQHAHPAAAHPASTPCLRNRLRHRCQANHALLERLDASVCGRQRQLSTNTGRLIASAYFHGVQCSSRTSTMLAFRNLCHFLYTRGAINFHSSCARSDDFTLRCSQLPVSAATGHGFHHATTRDTTISILLALHASHTDIFHGRHAVRSRVAFQKLASEQRSRTRSHLLAARPADGSITIDFRQIRHVSVR